MFSSLSKQSALYFARSFATYAREAYDQNLERSGTDGKKVEIPIATVMNVGWSRAITSRCWRRRHC
jgi:hypothetical protein